MTPCLLNLLLDFFANLVFPDNALALFHTHCRLAAVTQLDKTALIFSSPGALLLQKQTHLMSTQLPLANSPAVQKNQAVMWWDLALPEHVIYFCDEAKIEAGPTVYCMWKGHLTPLHLDINYIYFSESKPLCKTLLCAMHCVLSAAFLKVNLLVEKKRHQQWYLKYMWLNTDCSFTTFAWFLIKGPIISHINKPTCIPHWHKHLKTTWHISISGKTIQIFDAKVFRDQPVSLNICHRGSFGELCLNLILQTIVFC